ncbi:hypothetical protein GCM10025857_28440 [Alicyclobacillus contaminans]|nr:hypothetical protein GCM10025857_28440 [Alicyclobacillus contaminans]
METVMQRPVPSGLAEIVIVTHLVGRQALKNVLAALESSPNVQRVCCVLPVEVA